VKLSNYLKILSFAFDCSSGFPYLFFRPGGAPRRFGEGEMKNQGLEMMVALALASLIACYGLGAFCADGRPDAEPSKGEPSTEDPDSDHPEEGDGREATAAGGAEPAGDGKDVYAPEIVDGAGMRIAKILLARGVQRSKTSRTPVDPGTRFENDGRRIYVYLEVDNPDLETGHLSVGWIPPGNQREQGTVSVAIKAVKRWRTWAFNAYIGTPGVWHAVVRNRAGDVIARAPFEMLTADEAAGGSTTP
jgi:hypothetical protein